MMEFSRRGFLNLLGIGGAGLIAAEALPPLPLFGSDEIASKELVVPDASLTSGHFVVLPKGLTERVPPSESVYKGDPSIRVVARLVRDREPRKPHKRRDGWLHERPTLPDGTLVQEGHAAFYLASLGIRRKFAAFSTATLLGVEPELRSMATLVTIAETPIFASPLPERGFDVNCRFTQFVVLGLNRLEVETFRIYSEQGEYPLQAPRDVEMSTLIRLDKEVLSAGAASTDRVAGILANFTKTWSRA